MSQTRVKTTRTANQRRGRGKGFQQQQNRPKPVYNEEQIAFGEDQNNKPFANGNQNKRAFKQDRGKSYTKMWNDNPRNTFDEQQTFFKESFNAKHDGNKIKGENGQGQEKDHQQMSNDKPFANGNLNKSAFKHVRGKYYKKIRNDIPSNTFNEQQTFFEERFNAKHDNNKIRGDNRQVQEKVLQQISSDSSKCIDNEEQRHFEFLKTKFNQNKKAYNITGDLFNQSNERCYKPPKRSQFSSTSTSSRCETLSNSSVQVNNLVSRNVPKPPIHVQNPFFVDELMQRFNSILPPSSLLSPANPQETLYGEKNLESDDQSLVSVNVGDVFRHFQDPNEQVNLKLLNKNQKGNHSKENNPFQTMVQDNNRSYNKQSPSKGGGEPELQSGAPGYVERSPNIAPNAFIERTKILKPSGNTGNSDGHNKTNTHHIQSFENSLGKTLFAQIDEFQSKNTAPSKDVSQSYQSISRVDNVKGMGPVSNVAVKSTSTHNDNTNTYQTQLPENEVGLAQDKSETTLGLMTNNAASTNDFQYENTLGNLSTENGSPAEKSNPASSTNSPQSNQRNIDIYKRRLILRQHGFQGNASSQNKNDNQEKSAQHKIPISQFDQTVPSSESAVISISSPQPPCDKGKPLAVQRDSAHQTQSLHQKKILAHQNPEIDKTNSRCFITRSNSTSAQSGSVVTRGKLAGGRNVFNIHRPTRDLNQRAISRNDSIRRFEEEYTEQLRVHTIKQKEKEAKKREEWLAKYKHVDQGHRLSEGYLDEAIGGQDVAGYIESEVEMRERQQEQLRRDALVFQEQEKKKNEERIKREEEKKKKKLEKYKHVSSGQRLGGSTSEDHYNLAAHIESEEEIRERQQEQLRRDALLYQEAERKKNEERLRREEEKKKQELEKFKDVSSGHRLGGSKSEDHYNLAAHIESEEQIRERQQEQLRRDALLFQEAEKKKNEEKLRREEKQKSEEKMRAEEMKKQEFDQCKHVSSSHKLSGNQNEESSEDKKKKQMDNSSKDSRDPSDITSLFVRFLQTTGMMKNYSNGETEELLSQFQMFMANCKKTSLTQDNNLQPTQIESSDSSEDLTKKPASCTVTSASKGTVLVIRPTKEALDRTVCHHNLAVQDMDKHGQSSLYKPQIEQNSALVNNKFEWKQPDLSNRYQKPQSELVVTKNVEKSLDDIAKTTGAIPKTKPIVQSNEQELTEIDLREEMRAARLRMQKKYEESLRKQQDNN